MSTRSAVDLSTHINQTVERGHPADFPVVLRPLYYSAGDGATAQCVPNRLAVVRVDTGQAISVVSDRYKLVTHEAARPGAGRDLHARRGPCAQRDLRGPARRPDAGHLQGPVTRPANRTVLNRDA